MTQCQQSCASTEDCRQIAKIGIILECLRRDVSEIKLKRTDTTLDLSQKAKRAEEEKKRATQEGRAEYIYIDRGMEARAKILCAKPVSA